MKRTIIIHQVIIQMARMKKQNIMSMSKKQLVIQNGIKVM